MEPEVLLYQLVGPDHRESSLVCPLCRRALQAKDPIVLLPYTDCAGNRSHLLAVAVHRWCAEARA